MSKDIFAGTEGILMERDDALMLDLYLLDWATTDHLWPLHFPGCVRKRAYNRLCDLHTKKGVLVRRTMPVEIPGQENPVRVAFFGLAREARASVRAILGRRGLTLGRLFAEAGDAGPQRSNPEFAGLARFEPGLAWHVIKTTDLYAALKGTLLMHHGELGDGWLWRNERRAHIPYRDTEDHSYRPDAELIVDLPLPPQALPTDTPERFHLYFEVQTARSKKSRADIARRLTNHHLASKLRYFPTRENRVLVFVGESPAHVRAAAGEASRLELPAICGTEQEVVGRLKTLISDISRGHRPDPAILSPNNGDAAVGAAVGAAVEPGVDAGPGVSFPFGKTGDPEQSRTSPSFARPTPSAELVG